MVSDFIKFIEQEARIMKENGQQRTANAFLSTGRSFSAFAGQRINGFEELDMVILKEYEFYLTDSGKQLNTVSFYMRMLRTLYNRATLKGEVKRPRIKLFSDVYTGNVKTAKRAVSPSVIRKLLELKLMDSSLIFTRDLFLFSFYLRGMPFIDVAYLRKENIRGNMVIYQRKKTSQLLTVRLEAPAVEIINRYRSRTRSSKYVLPVLLNTGIPERTQYETALRTYNNRLKRLSDIMGLSDPLTSYVARHSWATIAKNRGIPLAIISEGLGHDSEKTTAIYLASFDTEVLGKANRRVIASILDTAKKGKRRK